MPSPGDVAAARLHKPSRNADHTITRLRPIRSARIPAKGAATATPNPASVTVMLTAISLALKIPVSIGSSGCVEYICRNEQNPATTTPNCREFKAPLLVRGLGFPRTGVMRLVPVFHAIVKMIVGGGAQRQIVQAGQAEPFAQVFIERVELLELARQRGNFLARGSPQKHLITAVHQRGDFPSHHDPSLADPHLSLAEILDQSAAPVARCQCTPTLALHFETQLLQARKAFFKRR